MKNDYTQAQAQFFDDHPPLAPWDKILTAKGLSLLFRPKDIYCKQILDGLKIKPSDKILEVGCGQGIYLKRIVTTYGVSGVGVDVSGQSINFAKKHWADKRLKFRLADGISLPFKQNYFDKVMSFDVLEHIKDQKQAINEMVRVLKPGGRLFIYTLNRNDKYTLDWFWYQLGFDVYAKARHRPELFIDPQLMKRQLLKLKLDSIVIQPYDAFFTLAAEELTMVMVWLLIKIGLGENQRVGRVFLRLSSWLAKGFYPLLLLLDRPWFCRGRSVGLSIVARKPVKND